MQTCFSTIFFELILIKFNIDIDTVGIKGRR